MIDDAALYTQRRRMPASRRSIVVWSNATRLPGHAPQLHIRDWHLAAIMAAIIDAG
jgi:hypothetical protein